MKNYIYIYNQNYHLIIIKYHQIRTLFLLLSMSASFASGPEIDAHFENILSDSRRASCQLLAKEWTQNIGKLLEASLGAVWLSN